MKKNILFISMIVIIIILGTVGVMASKSKESNEVIRIGVIAPMSGEAASYGDYIIKSLKMSVDDFNINNKQKIEAIYEDGNVMEKKQSPPTIN